MEAGSNCPWNSLWVGKRKGYFISVEGWLWVNGLLEAKLLLKSKTSETFCKILFYYLTAWEHLERRNIKKVVFLCRGFFPVLHWMQKRMCVSMSEVPCRSNGSVTVVAFLWLHFWLGPKSTEVKGGPLGAPYTLWTRHINSSCSSGSVVTTADQVTMSAEAEIVHGCMQVRPWKMQSSLIFSNLLSLGYV